MHYSRKVTAFFFSSWLALWPFLFEKINKTKVIFSGDDVPARERVLFICNHRTEVDWMYLWDLALRKDCLGYIKYILKSSLMKLPVFGWAFHILEFIPVERNWEVDEANMRQMLSKFKDPRDPLWLVLFPEGTDFNDQKCLRSQKYAAENGLPVLKNLLLPKSKGFHACLEDLRSTLDAVYDVTIGYKHRCPSFLDNVFGVDPSEVHIHIRRITLDDIPMSEREGAAWLMDHNPNVEVRVGRSNSPFHVVTVHVKSHAGESIPLKSPKTPIATLLVRLKNKKIKAREKWAYSSQAN
ncbi:hypothetical protein V6N11_081145 [Hibiscus sabdariffa]|uniref:1-acylglycerol-3-phosphate O-acyltransferase n=1 Tax=Hibiscus sabdariffa TaxID=183260 RepID=A0ABR2QJ02_9ROSI